MQRADLGLGLAYLVDIELSAVARLIDVAQRQRLAVRSYGIRPPDIFDLLDEQVIQERYPKFPGHEAARDAYRRARAQSTKKLHWKDWYRRKYGIHLSGDDVAEEVIRPIAVAMRAQQRVSTDLRHVVQDVCRDATNASSS